MNSLLKTAIVCTALPVTTAGGVLGYNHVSVGAPVADAVASDTRSDGLTLRAHFGGYVNAGTLVLDLSRVDAAAPADLWRVLFQSAEVLHTRGRRFERVVVARDGSPVFLLEGDDFARIGAQRVSGENPVYMIRTLPSKLHHPDGRAAYGEWSGGFLGVLVREMEDGNAAARRWAAGAALAGEGM